jgi:outer membrane receptor protein involved in Fe transport
MLKVSPNLITTAVLGLGLAGHVHAQLDSALVLEEVIVTAQKRTESLKDTPKTVNVVSGEQVRDFAALSFEELNNMTAGLAISGSNFDANIATRGLGTDLNATVWSRVTVHLDGALIAVERGLFTGLYDLSRIELLRGPQGTLYGQSSPAGVITIQSRDPNLNEIDGYIQQSFTDRKGSNTQFGVSLPVVTNELGVRVSGLYDSNEHNDVENITLEKDLENETTAFRIVALWTPSENFDLRLAYHDIEDDFDIDPVVRGNGLEADERIALADFDSYMKSESDYTILEMNYAFANDWTATLVGSKQDHVLTVPLDSDGSPVQGREQRSISDVSDLYNIELRLASQGNDTWDWTIGAFYQDTDGGSEAPVAVDNWFAAAPGLSFFVQTTGLGLQDARSLGVFTHNSIHLSEHGTLTVGLRYNEDERFNLQPFMHDIYEVLPDGSLVFRSSQSSQGVLPEDQESKDDALTGTLKYQYHFSDDFMTYASYDRGWRGGSAKIASIPGPSRYGTFEAEGSDSVEVGFKWQILNGRGLLNVAAYYQRYSDFHYLAESVEYRDIQGGISQASPVVNVDEAESYGFDSDITVLLSQYWRLSAALSYNRAELSDAQDIPCTSGEPISEEFFDFNICDLTGERAGNQPQWSGNLATEYHRALASGNSEWYLRGLLNAESQYYSASEREDLDSYVTLDLFLGLRSAAGTWDGRVWVKNLFDESAELNTGRLPLIPDYQNGAQVESGLTWVKRQLNPRTIGLTVSYTF